MSPDSGAVFHAESSRGAKSVVREWFFVIGLVYLLLVAVSLIGGGFKAAAGENAAELFAIAKNPVTGLVIGTVATALIQSSSTVTSIIVGLVAGGLPVGIAIPMVMGANIGTTITNTIVSLGHVRDGEEFRRAFAAATVHDFFNLLCVFIFLPLEMLTGYLRKTGYFLAGLMAGGESISIKDFNPVKPLVKPVVHLVQDSLAFTASKELSGVFMIGAGVLLIVGVITLLSRLLKQLMVGRAKEIMHKSVARGPLSGLFSGLLLTVLVQSSSTTTSLVVPLAGNGVFSLKKVYPFTLGANIGTCITALFAATAITGPASVFALQIAFVHMVYNVSGVMLIYGLPFLRNIPLRAAETLAQATSGNKLYALVYILGVFFLVPGIFITLSNRLGL
ncbi:sodium:phosphate symporter [Prosthecochloris sp. GSB1]|uniref:Na/Pi symporter n=1 Tax=Prosthecochloris sp. GSB1 TaxID=281093 RepID=UPI000B8CE52D|nr:Na/Pi symporter [Prosthecochloris sp. GSB1]ASQ90826.1 sodium:phosphate symporter [Prosthecochloris sp. GSB1]